MERDLGGGLVGLSEETFATTPSSTLSSAGDDSLIRLTFGAKLFFTIEA